MSVKSGVFGDGKEVRNAEVGRAREISGGLFCLVYSSPYLPPGQHLPRHIIIARYYMFLTASSTHSSLSGQQDGEVLRPRAISLLASSSWLDTPLGRSQALALMR